MTVLSPAVILGCFGLGGVGWSVRCLLAGGVWLGGVGQGGLAGVGFDQGPWTGRTRVETDPTRTCQLLVGLPDVVVLGFDACAGDAPLGSVTHGPRAVSVVAAETTADQRFGPAWPSHGGHRSHPRLRCGPHLMAEMGHKSQSARRGHHIGAAEGFTAPAAALM